MQATGSGKTHTISGTANQPGVIYLKMADLFHLIEVRKEEYSYDVLLTFLEIYNEEIRDVLAEPGHPTPRGGLQIREDKSVKVAGLTQLHPTSADEVEQIVLLGNTRQTQSPTNANETSSRSRAVLQIHATRSLPLRVGNCINSLCESGGAIRHAPYRNSKLTHLLKFSLGGNCKTVMIVCVAPTLQHFDNTHNTIHVTPRANFKFEFPTLPPAESLQDLSKLCGLV